MTNAKEVKKIFRPLIEKHADLVQIGSHWLWIQPVNHVALRILIERSSDKDYCWPKWTMLETFIPSLDLLSCIGYSAQLTRPPSSHGSYWRWSDPAIIPDLISAIELDALPRLRTIDSLEAFWAVYGGSEDRARTQWPEDRMIFDIALGDLDAARAIHETLAPQFRDDPDPDDVWFQRRRRKILTVTEPLLAGDRPALANILHGWEAENIRGTQIEPYWQPTPFPLERASA